MVLRFTVHRIHWIVGIAVTTLCNGVLGPLLPSIIISWGLFWTILPSLIIASFINVTVAVVAWFTIRKSIPQLVMK